MANNANDLKDRIEVWKYDVSTNSAGTPIEQFLFYKYTYANVKFISGSTENNTLGNLPFSNTQFTIRYDKLIDYHCQLKYENVFYKIEHIQNLEREGFMKLQTVVFNQTFD